jgi:hypothetical protein
MATTFGRKARLRGHRSGAIFGRRWKFRFERRHSVDSVGGHTQSSEISSGARCAVSALIASYFGTTKVHVVVDSTVFTDGVHTHTFEDTRDYLDEVFWARIYAGLHFYHSLHDGSELGSNIAEELFRNHFRLQHDNPQR